MKYFRLFLIFWSFLHSSVLTDARGTTELDSLLTVLDREIGNPQYKIDRDNKIELLRRQISSTSDDATQFAVNAKIIDLFVNYQSDSILSYLEKNIELAKKMGDIKAFNRTTIRKSYVLGELAIPHEALDALNTINPETLDRENLIPYYESATNLYRITRSETRNKRTSHQLDSLYTAYRDSILVNLDPESTLAYQNRIDSLSANGEHKEALRMIRILSSRVGPEDPMYGFTQYSLAMVLDANGLTEERDVAFARSALSDIRNCAYENASLANLANNLVERGDFSRAYNYIQRALKDANAFNSSYRRNLLSPSIASIETAYHNDLNNRHSRLTVIFVFTLVVSLIIGGLSFVLYRTMKRKHTLNSLLQEAYDKEHVMNNELQVMNNELQGLNNKLSEANLIKEECIHSFLTNSLDNLNTLEQYRMMIHTKLANKQYAELTDIVKNNSFGRNEVEAYYRNFDRVVLRIFPGFVESFNSLLRPDALLQPKKENSLTPELRIFALIRLGVDNPTDIAKLLRYSMSTIYNYRVKVRKNAREGITPEDFESMVMRIDTI